MFAPQNEFVRGNCSLHQSVKFCKSFLTVDAIAAVDICMYSVGFALLERLKEKHY